jgi:RNA polymerase sigma-70 factor (ECF subfamily)
VDARVTTGREAELSELWTEQGPRLWRALFAYTGDREVATDAVAEAFAQFLRRGSEVRSPGGWIWRAAFRLAAGELQRRRRWASFPEEDRYEMTEPATDLLRALGSLPPKQRAALVLHYYAGYTAREAAGIVGSTPATVRVHLSQGRKRLRRMLEETDE